MKEYSPALVDVREMFASIAERYDLANTVLSLGMHHRWKRWLIEQLPPNRSARALDLCTGTGDLLFYLAERCGALVGADFCPQMIGLARKRLAKRGIEASFVQADAHALPFESNSFDVVTISFGVRN